MSWGDPFDKFYKDEDEDARRDSIVKRGLTPGALVTYGKLGGTAALTIWDFPDFKADQYTVLPGVGVVLAVDCESDPTDDWVMLLINTPQRLLFGWLPTQLVTRVE